MTVVAIPRFTGRYIDTTASQDIDQAIGLARNTPMVISISGAPGTGKTTALLHQREELGAYYCTVTNAYKSVRGIMILLLETFGLYALHRRSSIYDIHNELYGKLPGFGAANGGNPQLLIIDECQSLDNAAMREVLTLQEHSGISVVFSGNDQRLAQTKSHDSAIGQISRRIDWRIRLGKPSKEDCEAFCAEYNVAFDQVSTIIKIGQNTSIDTIVKIITRARVFSGAVGPVKREHLQPAISSIYVPKEACKLLQSVKENR